MSIWTPGKIPGVGTRHALGLYLNYRKLASGVAIPSQVERLQLHGKVANWFTMFDAAVPFGETVNGDFAGQGNVRILALMGTVSVLDVTDSRALCAVQFYDAGKQILWSAQPVNFVNQLGTASNPFWLRSPYVMAPNTHLQTQVQNLFTRDVTAQVIAFGYQD